MCRLYHTGFIKALQAGVSVAYMLGMEYLLSALGIFFFLVLFTVMTHVCLFFK